MAEVKDVPLRVNVTRTNYRKLSERAARAERSVAAEVRLAIDKHLKGRTA
jgi:hypothetical protein